MRKISVRFEEGSVEESIFISNFYQGLGLDPKRWLQEQEVELSEETRFTLFEMKVPLPEGLQNQQTWVCRLEKRDKFQLFWVGDFAWAGEAFDHSLSDLSPLSGLQDLTSLNLEGCKLLSNLGPLRELTALTSLNLVQCKSLSDLGPLSELPALKSLNLVLCNLIDLDTLSKLQALTSLDLGACTLPSDIGFLSKLQALTSLNLGGCRLPSDIGPLSKLQALTSLNLHHCYSLSDLGPLSGLTALTSLNLSECNSLRDLGPLSGLQALRFLEFSSRRVQSIEPLRGISSLRELSEFNPPEVDELLAHAAFRRGDRLRIQDQGNSWLKEAKDWRDGPSDLQDRFAATLGECFSLLGESEVGSAYEKFLQSRPDFSVAPWKAWLGGTLRESGFELYCQRVERLPVASMLVGAIGGACATLPYEEHAEWSRKWLQALKTARLSDAKSLLSVAPEICLAHARLGEKEALGRWLVQFTDPSDSTALDPVQAALASFQLACGEFPAAENHTFAIQSPAVRDPVLGALVAALAAADLDRASAYLLLIVDQSRKSALAKQLAAEPGVTEAVLHRLLVAVGNAGFDLAEWISAIPDPAGKRLIREFSARTQGERREILSRVAEDLRRCADEFLAEVSDDK